MQPYDACRLIAVNLFSFVDNPFTDKAKFNFDKFYQINYKAMRLSDDLIDLELESIKKILNKINSGDESLSIKMTELDLWERVYNTARSSRRTGLGFTALGDTLAALNLKYDSEEGLKIVEQIMSTKMSSELDCTIDLSILRGSFEGWDKTKEFDLIESNELVGNNSFYNFIAEEFPEAAFRMFDYGRRNCSFSTVAPTGSVSILTQTTSGLEPLFMPYYMRRKKVNPNDKDIRVDFTDQNGDTWQEFPILHPKFKAWINTNFDKLGLSGQENIEIEISKDNLQKAFELSPWYGSTANDIDWSKRVEIQGIIQKYISHSISSTINLPEDVSEAEVSKIYMESWKKGLKGITVYRDGSRSGVLVDSSKSTGTKFEYRDAPKRPSIVDAQVYHINVSKHPYTVIVGLIDKKPYEIFVTENHLDIATNNKIIKLKKGNYETIEGVRINIFEDPNVELMTRLVSTSLRHGADIKFIVEQLNKTSGDITSFSKAVSRVLKKYIPDGSKSTVHCLDCGSDNVVFEEGCQVCKDCGSSKCG
jgi:ribonucleoside-diphosphate reductase alpha chain